MKMYTAEGQIVEVVKKLDEGWLGKTMYEDYRSDSEDGDFEPEWVSDDKILFFDALYENPLTEAYATEVKKLKSEIGKLQSELLDIRDTKRSEEGLLHKVGKYPFVQALVDYLVGDYEFILYLRNYSVKNRQSVWSSVKVYVTFFSKTGCSLYKLYSDHWIDAGKDDEFMIFKTKQEITEFAKKSIIGEISVSKSNYNPVHYLSEWFNKIDASCGVKNDPDVKAAYDSKIAELTKQEQGERAKRLQEEVNQLEAKKKELEKLTPA
jgi:hypothetical protein